MDVKREPKLTHGDVEKIDLGQLGEFLTALTGAQAGGLFNGPAGPRIQRYLLEQAGMPTPTEAEAQQAADEEQQRNEQEAPGQGRTACAAEQSTTSHHRTPATRASRNRQQKATRSTR
jgi:hypothetical protein